MKLARIIYKDDEPWGLSDGGEINPPIGTIVQHNPQNQCFRMVCVLSVVIIGCIQ